jgi:hypothetical protein
MAMDQRRAFVRDVAGVPWRGSPPGLEHSITNSGLAELVFLVVCTCV